MEDKPLWGRVEMEDKPLQGWVEMEDKPLWGRVVMGKTFVGTGGDGGQTFVGTGGDWDEFVFSCSCPLANELNVCFSVHSLSPEAAQYETCYVTAHKGACRCASFHPNGLSFCFD